MSDNFWKDRNVFVTGCTGLLGSWLTDALCGKGANVVGLVRDLVPRSNLRELGCWEKINVVRGEVEDYALLERVLNEYEIDTVFHLAAQTIVSIANRSPLSTFEANIKGTWNLLEAARRVGTVQRIVVASSDKAYGSHEKLPYSEDAPLQGRHPYDVSKSCADLLARAYFETYDLPVSVTRCGNLFGGGDLNWNRIIPGTIRSVHNGEAPIIRSDGEYIRDYFFVKDAVAGYLLQAEKTAEEGVRGEAFNFSDERQINVLELVNLIIKLMGREDIRPCMLDQVRGEIRHQYLDSVKARRVLGWKPLFTLEDGLIATIEWYRSFLREEPGGGTAG
ncbi:MAG: GDP-mannose 4,6-dehydratase [Candidatus Erginobacter occultus]|nr:GDP-mannose 4,6-dehydratase [Candidatus Erginobacter occultus]